jgi:hypothetical protein
MADRKARHGGNLKALEHRRPRACESTFMLGRSQGSLHARDRLAQWGAPGGLGPLGARRPSTGEAKPPARRPSTGETKPPARHPGVLGDSPGRPSGVLGDSAHGRAGVTEESRCWTSVPWASSRAGEVTAPGLGSRGRLC